jgi:hypothetical protein
MRAIYIFLVLTLTLVITTVGIHAQDGVVSIDGITNTYSPYTLMAGSTHILSVRYNLLANEAPGSSANPWWGSNGFEIYSPDGANWVSFTGTMQPLVTNLTCNKFRKHYLFDGTSWVATSGAGSTPSSGSTGTNSRAGYSLVTFDYELTSGYVGGQDNDIALTFQFQSLMVDSNKTLCFDTCAAVVAWEWSNGNEDYPVWDNGLGQDAPRCWTIKKTTCCGVEWCPTGTTGNVTFAYCTGGSYNLCAYDYSGGQIVYEFAPGYESGFGALDPISGLWTWYGATVPTSGFLDIIFRARDAIGSYTVENFVLHVTIDDAYCNCCDGRVGDVNGSGEDEPTISDISTLIDFLFISGSTLTCIEEADVNQSGGATPYASDITISDISTLIDYLFITGPENGTLLNCW